MQKAKNNGMPFSSVINLAIKAYVEGLWNIGIIEEEKFNEKTRKELDAAIRDIKKGKGLSPVFSTIEEVRTYLKK